jgi:CspA family cold shock protein
VTKRQQGLVKWFNCDKGYGFLVSDDFKEDIFVHSSSIKQKRRCLNDGKYLKEGQTVTFVISSSSKGLAATEVRIDHKLELQELHDTD